MSHIPGQWEAPGMALLCFVTSGGLDFHKRLGHMGLVSQEQPQEGTLAF